MKYLSFRPFMKSRYGSEPDTEQLASLAKVAAFGAVILAAAYFTFVLVIAKG